MSRARIARARSLRLPLYALAAPGLLYAGAARAASEVPMPDAVIAEACGGNANAEIDQFKLAKSLVRLAIGEPTEWVAAELSTPSRDTGMQVFRAALLAKLTGIATEPNRDLTDAEGRLLLATGMIEKALRKAASTADAPLRVVGPIPDQNPFLFTGGFAGRTLRCGPADPESTLFDEWQKVDRPLGISVRATPEELSLVGEDRRAAGAFALAGDRTRSTLDDGTRKTDTTLKVSGTVGWRITPKKSDAISYLYVRYDLDHARSRPAPTLAPGASESDGDTDALETGIQFHGQLLPNEGSFKMYLDSSVSTVFDFANDASRLKVGALLRPVWTRDLPVCGVENAQPFLGTTLLTRCGFQVEVQAAEVLKRGTTPLGTYDSFLAAGARGSFEAFLPTGKGPELLGTVGYRILPVLHGAPDRIERVEASLKYRFWTKAKAGIDVGFSYARGTNELSFEQEDVLSFGLGILY